jgi:hypothetical protein
MGPAEAFISIRLEGLERPPPCCQGVADKKSTMPVLCNVLLEVASPNELRLAAPDPLFTISLVVNQIRNTASHTLET